MDLINGRKTQRRKTEVCEDGRKSFVIPVITININGFNSIIDQETNSQFRLKK